MLRTLSSKQESDALRGGGIGEVCVKGSEGETSPKS